MTKDEVQCVTTLRKGIKPYKNHITITFRMKKATSYPSWQTTVCSCV